MQVLGGLVQAGVLVHGRSVHDEDDAVDVLGVRERGSDMAAQLPVAGGVVEDEAAGALEGRVAGGAVVRGGGHVRFGEEGLDGLRSDGGVGGGDGATLSLWWQSC